MVQYGVQVEDKWPKEYRFKKYTNEREVDFQHMDRISSEYTAGSRDERSKLWKEGAQM